MTKEGEQAKGHCKNVIALPWVIDESVIYILSCQDMRPSSVLTMLSGWGEGGGFEIKIRVNDLWPHFPIGGLKNSILQKWFPLILNSNIIYKNL